MGKRYIEVNGARVHNLKQIDVTIPHDSLTVITGISGSGKSSLAFDTLYAEGQRRYIESLSSYARQFLGKLNKPEVDYIKGISPAIAIEQKVNTSNPRSTVGTSTEIYDYLKVLFAKLGKTYSPISGEQVKKHTVTDVIDYIRIFNKDERLVITCPVPGFVKYGAVRQLEILKQQGFVRLLLGNTFIALEDLKDSIPSTITDADLVIDRITADLEHEEQRSRIGDSVALAFAEGAGICKIYHPESEVIKEFSDRFELDGMEFQEPNVHLFTFNNPFGACKRCEGYGQVIGIDPDLVIPNKTLSVFEGAVQPWHGEKMGEYLDYFIKHASAAGFPIHKPINQLSQEHADLLWNGKGKLEGINAFFKYLESKSYKIQYRVMLSRYRGRTTCPDCNGTRLRHDANYVRIDGKSITDIVSMSVTDALHFFIALRDKLPVDQVTRRILPEIINRLQFLSNVGLTYLTLNRMSNSLSGGESQRINLATSLGSNLVGSMYILDEPSIGLHPRDTKRLIDVLLDLRNLGNAVIVVEHDEDMMLAADHIVDIGPRAGIFGGEVVFAGKHAELLHAERSLTAEYLTGKREIAVPKRRRISNSKLKISQATLHNLKDVNVDFPLHALVCVTGVSGSGKSTLIRQILHPAVKRSLGLLHDDNRQSCVFGGDIKMIKAVEFIDQNPIGRSSRSNPATYVKAYDDIRELFSIQSLAKSRGYKPGFFSFNVEGGRCEVCEGEGIISVSMQFMADVHLTCEQCLGTRFKQETLDVLYNGRTIADILEMDILTAHDLFKESGGRIEQKIVAKLEPFLKVGLGYLKMGQPSSTLSGGEAQRIKLASFLAKGTSNPPTLFIFDEPTTGLHFHDVNKLIIALNELIDKGHSVIVIEHNLDVIKCADHIIDLGPEGGIGGGKIVFTGTPEELIRTEENYTGAYLREKLDVKKG